MRWYSTKPARRVVAFVSELELALREIRRVELARYLSRGELGRRT